MSIITINLPDQQAATLTAEANARGLTIEEWIAQHLANDEAEMPVRSPQEAAAHIWELRKQVKPDPKAGRYATISISAAPEMALCVLDASMAAA